MIRSVKCALCLSAAFALASGIARAAEATGVSPLSTAHQVAQRASRETGRRAATGWLRCALMTHEVLAKDEREPSALPLANRCIGSWLTEALQHRHEWSPGRQRVLGLDVVVEFRGLSPYLGDTIRLVKAADVSMQMFGGERFLRPGFGVPLVAIHPRCSDRPECALLPYSGVFRSATAWIESAEGADARLVVADPLVAAQGIRESLGADIAEDTSAPYAYGMGSSPVGRMALWGLLGRGKEIGRRSGIYLMEDYDPTKRPLVMIHGLGSSPLVWAKLTNAIWGQPELRKRYQIWHVVYQTDAPLLVTRRRIAGYLQNAWTVLDPEGDDPARNGIVLVGHSLGGVLSRLLTADSGQALWTASFTVPPEELEGDAADLELAQQLLIFERYPRVRRAIFMGAPHHGSPSAGRWYARLVRGLAGYRTPELQALSRLASAQPSAVRDEIRTSYQLANINSISTLQPEQPVRRAGEVLMPAFGIRYHTIAGRLPRTDPASDGAVPLASAMLDGADSSLIIESGHDLPANDEAIAEVLRILRDDLTTSNCSDAHS